jgi:hypothetical protein
MDCCNAAALEERQGQYPGLVEGLYYWGAKEVIDNYSNLCNMLS